MADFIDPEEEKRLDESREEEEEEIDSDKKDENEEKAVEKKVSDSFSVPVSLGSRWLS